ncbi:MAG: tRNA (adenosine(37)-N6)-threonylcarbamoyltransferase complex dimerization subunit type 1 TsaB [Chitinophagales bacterium]
MSAPMLLLIETSSPVCSVALSSNGHVKALREISVNANHASMLIPMIEELMKETLTDIQALDGIALSSGPGSYTGLRIGAATAKGLCYSLRKPLITLDSLQVLAWGMSRNRPDSQFVYCPSIDARRDEIYYGLFNNEGAVVKSSANIILTSGFLGDQPSDKKIIIGGSGALKCRQVLVGHTIEYDLATVPSACWMVTMAEEKFRKGDLDNYVSFEPNYIKPAFISSSKQTP